MVVLWAGKLSTGLLGQMQAVLPAKNAKFKKLGDLLEDFAEGLGWPDRPERHDRWCWRRQDWQVDCMITRRKPKDVPALKSEISKILRDAQILDFGHHR